MPGKDEQPWRTGGVGEEITRDVRVRRPAGIVLSVRLTAEETEQIQRLAQVTAKGISEVARIALRSFLDNGGYEAQAHGVSATSSWGGEVRIRPPRTGARVPRAKVKGG